MTASGGGWAVARPSRRAGSGVGWVALLPILLALVVAGTTLATPPSAGGAVARGAGPFASGFAHWSTYHGSENRSGYTPVDGPTAPQVAWYVCPSGFPIRSGPVTDGATVYVADEIGNLFALNRTDHGRTLWNRSVGASATQPEVDGANLFVGTSTGSVVDLAAADGRVVWNTSLGSPIVQGPATVAGLVLAGTEAGTVVALDNGTGALRWSTHLGGPVAGAVAVDGTAVYAVDSNGTVERLDVSGHLTWSAKVGAGVDTAVAVSGPDVLVGDLGGGVTDLWASNGTIRWGWSSHAVGTVDPVEATPAVDPARVYVAFDSGTLRAFDRTNGAMAWQTPPAYSGLPNIVAPAVAPNGVYAVVNGVLQIVDLDPATGNATWNQTSPNLIFGIPALEQGDLLFGTEFGCIGEIGSLGAATPWPVAGVVRSFNGTALNGASVTIGSRSTSTNASGGFALTQPNGTYPFSVFAVGFDLLQGSLTVAGPDVNLTFILRPLTLYSVTGTVVDGWSGAGLAGVRIDAVGPLGYDVAVTTGADGRFSVELPNGSTTLQVPGPPGFGAGSVLVAVAGGPVHGVIVTLPPVVGRAGNALGPDLELALPAAALGAAALAAGVREHNRRRAWSGLPPGVLSPFARFVAMRLLLLIPQVLVLLAVVYLFGTVLPIVAAHGAPAALDPAVGPACTFSWPDIVCESTAFGYGLGQLAGNLFAGQWGWASFGALQAPVTQYLIWWLPDSIELGVVALALSMAIAYPLALLAGWRRTGPLDVASRLASLAGLLIPSFLVALLVVLAVGTSFQNSLGDAPFGTLPSQSWFVLHRGGPPSWVGTGDSTGPTRFPILDGAIHRDWTFEAIVAAKLLVQASAIAVVYLTIFLRHAWSVVSHAAEEPHVRAARSRGVPERTLLWHHTGRRVLPYYLLTFALTLPAFVGTQALVEALFSAQGVGAILLLEITNLTANPPGITGPISGNLYQVVVFLLILFILLTTLLADIVARYLDPRLRAEAS